MALTTGTRLGPYEVLGPLGVGGMGEVYRARDAKLNREVALKVLPGSLASDPDRLARFRREAQVLASLNHPNIAHIHGFEDSGTTHALVMELVEGPTLAERIAHGPIPLTDALPIARQIADALEAAHEQSIIHRDLKPANVKVRADGTVKVLDFGLAKAVDPATSSGADVMNSPTLTGHATQMGMILGTAAYMAPEQARGKAVDRRADIWAFGVVVYEMLTGQRAIRGEEASDVMAAVLRQDIDWSALPVGTPSRLRRLLERCLERDPKTRLRDIGEARVEIARIEAGASDAAFISNSPASAPRVRLIRILPWALFAAVSLGLVGFLLWSPWRTAPLVTGLSARFQYALPADQQFTRPGRHYVAISPDGSKIAYIANAQLYVRALDELDAQPIRGTANEDPADLVFSPDSKSIAYFAGGTVLRKIAVSGGAPVTLCQTQPPWGVSWRNGLIAFGQSGNVSGIQAVPDSGGTPRMLVTADSSRELAIQPELLGDGVHVLFTTVASDSTGGERQIVVQRIDGGARSVLVKGGTNARVLESGHLVYINDTTIFAVPFDAARLAVTGGPVPVVEGVRDTNLTWAGQFDVSRKGTLAYVPAAFNQAVLVWVDRQGREKPVAVKPQGFQYPRLSPDGARIVMTSGDGENDIWIWDVAKETLTRLTFGPARELYATWMPDSRRVVFGSGNENSLTIFRRTADGTGGAESLTNLGGGGEPQSISPDGKFLVYRKGLGDLTLLSLEGDRQSKPLLANPRINEFNGEVSPDGRWLAYQSDETGRPEVYVRPFPNVDGSRWQISSDGGVTPLWARSGRELFFVSSRTPRRIMSVAVEPGLAFGYGKPQPLWDATLYLFGTGRNFDIGADGRLLMLRGADGMARQTSITVVTNWFDELRARMDRSR
jgi:WD40 repeat protein